jgi:long-chain fatty acid transport protein
MRNTSKVLLIAAVAILISATAFASGFGYYEHGAKATGMAGAFVAQANDASAIYYNPAGIAFLEGTHVMGAFHPVKPSVTVSYAGTSTDGETPWLPPASAYISHQVTDNITVGMGTFVPYGLEVKFPKNWQGSALNARSYLSSYYYRPTIAIKVNENLALGASFDYVWSKLTLERQSAFSVSPFLPSGRVETELNANGDGYGFTVGALMKASENLQLGIKYQHEVEIDYEGDAEFAYIAAGHPLVDGAASMLFVDQGAKTTITMPAELVVGVMFKPSDKLILEVDLQYTKWDSYETLVGELDNPMLSFEDPGNWDNTFMVRVGAQYEMAREWAIRGGYIFDTSPIPDNTLKPILPDADRNEFTAGLGYDTKEACCWGRFTADFAIQYILFDERTSKYPEYPATYETDVLILGFGIGLNF